MPTSHNMPTLVGVQDIDAGYGDKEVVHHVSLSVCEGEIVALIGHNGAGKSTLLKAIFGLLPLRNGNVYIDRQLMTNLSPARLIQKGIVYVPQGNQVFTDLTVSENIELRSVAIGRRNTHLEIQEAAGHFPGLQSKLGQPAGCLSGGEKQMVALASAMVLKPRLLLLDEPSLGMSASAAGQIFDRFRGLSRAGNLSILICEQRIRDALRLSQRLYVMRRGSIVFEGSTANLGDESRLVEEYFK
jgi:ABC-type branched-subunit amino acid transport system ATPase component